MDGRDGEGDRRPQIDGDELRRALMHSGTRESLIGSGTPLERFLRQAGAYFRPLYEAVNSTDWDGSICWTGPGDTVLRDAIPPSPELPFSELAPLLEMGSFARELVARHPSTPRDGLLSLAGEEYSIEMGIAERRDKGADVEMRLATSPFSTVRHKIALDPATSGDALAVLARDPAPLIRRTVMDRADVSEAILSGFVEDADADLRAHLAAHPRVNTEWLEKLAGDPIEKVRRAAARHPRTPADTLARIAGQPMDGETQTALAQNPRTPPAVLSRLFAGATAWRRALIASHPTLPEALARAAADDPDGAVRVALAKSAATPPEILARLASDPDERVRSAAKARLG